MSRIVVCQLCKQKSVRLEDDRADQWVADHVCPPPPKIVKTLTCPLDWCDWTLGLTGTEIKGYAAAARDVHSLRPGHPQGVHDATRA